MPRIKNPGSIKTGSGKALPTTMDNLVLTGGGMVPVGNNIGQPGYVAPGGGVRLGIPAPSDTGGADLSSHVSDPSDAHEATAIGIGTYPDLFYSKNVEGALDEMASGVAVRPPMLGQSANYTTFSGIPDWGVAKLADRSNSGIIANPEIYTEYWTAPSPTTDWSPTSLTYAGSDPQTDMVWNGNSVNGLNIPGTGIGRFAAGAFTEVDNSVVRTRGAAVQDTNPSTGPFMLPVTVSGSIFPADRGVIAIIHWPKENTVVDFLAQPVLDRCVAALVMGSGAGDGAGSGACITKDTIPPVTCDGSPGTGPVSGSIFSIGLNPDGSYNPFEYPGQASGQYDLHEINTGISDIDGSPLAIPWDTPWVRNSFSINRGAGQVRLGTDATVDPPLPAPSLVVEYGIPVLGAGPDAYDAGGVAATVTLLNVFPGIPAPTAYPYLGQTLVLDTNFFRYRLPYLKDYSKATGLKYTPHGIDPYLTRESARYFVTGPVNTYEPVSAWMTNIGGTDYLNQAGNYDNFQEDYWTWQVARFRHSFYVPGSDITGVNLGTYWMIHFKTEANFEAFVRDGIMPWAAAPDGYEVYGATLLDTTADNVASDYNLVNPLDSAVVGPPFGTPFAPGKGPAPDYGYSSRSYHVLRSSMVTANNTTNPTVVTKTFDWAMDTPVFMYVSGVAYFVPVNAAAVAGFWLSDMALDVTQAWIDFYRTEDNPLTTDAQIPPARLSSPCPVFMGLAPFTFEVAPQVPGALFGTLTSRSQRLEIPFTHLGFTDVVGPTNVDHIIISTLNTGVKFTGDIDLPAFSTEAVPTVFIRRPLSDIPIQPVTATDGNGIKMVPTPDGGAKILYHSTKWHAANILNPLAAHYGNFVGAVPPACAVSLVTPLKDTEERFLDEIYRYYGDFNAIGDPGTIAAIVGPGIGAWIGGPIPVPVRAGDTAEVFAGDAWSDNSTFQTGDYATPLVGWELQVAGLPYRNPAYLAGVQYPFPSAGLVQYPKTDYSAGYTPGLLGEAVVQPNYVGSVGTRFYTRCFDAAFARFGSDPVTPYVPSVIGQPLVVFRIEGLRLEDFAYTAPGAGGLGDGVTFATYTGIAIMVKVPGLTTWMDLGRMDGAGPSKQDPAQDGAGCQVAGVNTFDVYDSSTGMVGCQVKANVGPWANLCQGIETVPASGVFEVPILVRVIMNELAVDYDMTLEYLGPPGQFGVVPTPGLLPNEVRGLCGIKVVHPSLVQSL